MAPADKEAAEERRAPPKEVASHTVAMLGTRGVGKTALISQFMTSECINAYDRQRGEFHNNNFMPYTQKLDKTIKKRYDFKIIYGSYFYLLLRYFYEIN